MDRNYSIDILKGLSIISVIVLHSLSKEILYNLYAPYHIWNAVPIFLLLFAFNNSIGFQYNKVNLLQELYSTNYFNKRIKRIIIPFLYIWIFEIIIELNNKTRDLNWIIKSFLTGGFGPGGYFIPLIIQCVVIIPFLYYVGKKNSMLFLSTGFAISLLLEYLCLLFGVSDQLYRILFVRYLFSLVLGVWLVTSNLKKPLFYLIVACGSLISYIYITLVSYYNYSFIIEPLWRAEHAPAFFWPLLILLLINSINFKIKNLAFKILSMLGQASLHIFLVQMVYFRLVQLNILNISTNETLYTIINIVFCSSMGLVFFYFENRHCRKTLYNEIHPEY